MPFVINAPIATKLLIGSFVIALLAADQYQPDGQQLENSGDTTHFTPLADVLVVALIYNKNYLFVSKLAETCSPSERRRATDVARLLKMFFLSQL